MPSRQHMEARDILLERMRGAIHVHRKYMPALAMKPDDWTDTTLYRFLCKSAV